MNLDIIFGWLLVIFGLHGSAPLSGKLTPLKDLSQTLGLGLLGEKFEARAISRASEVLKSMGLGQSDPPMERVLLTGDAKCNDGTQAGFYQRLSPKSRRWVVFLEGGWYCFDKLSCESRFRNSAQLMTSLGWEKYRNIEGILSPDPAQNPHWWRSNHIYIPYCSSDCWSGRSKGAVNVTHLELSSPSSSESDSFSSLKNFTFTANQSIIQFESLHFMGAVILERTIAHLISLGLGEGHSLILAGSSAGGIGVFLNLDNVYEQLKKLGVNVDVRGIADSSWFLDSKPFAPRNCLDAHSCPPTMAMELGHSLWKSQLPISCKEANKNSPWECFLGYKVLLFVHRPLYIFQWIFDEVQLLLNNVGKPVSKKHWNYIHRTGQRIKHSLSDVSAVFAPSCISHTELIRKHWSSVQIRGVKLPDALECWASQPVIITETASDTSNLKYPDKLSISTLSQEPVLKPDILSRKKTHSISNRHRQGSHKRSKYARRKHRRKNRRRQSKTTKDLSAPKTSSILSEKSTQFPTNKVITNRNMLADSPENDSFGQVNRKEKRKHHNKTLKKSEKMHQRKKNRTRRKKRRKNNRLKKERRRNKRKRKRKRGEGDKRSKHEREKSRKRRRSSITKNKSDAILASDKPKHFRSYPTISEFPENGEYQERDRCPTHLVDECSWPHCNPTCPPLINPYTGEEMDRVELLKSFGLNMVDLANALGVDLSTLKSMDNKDIFLILTP